MLTSARFERKEFDEILEGILYGTLTFRSINSFNLLCNNCFQTPIQGLRRDAREMLVNLIEFSTPLILYRPQIVDKQSRIRRNLSTEYKAPEG